MKRLWLGDRVLGASFALLLLYYVVQPGVFEGKHSGDGLHAFNYLKAIFYHQTLDMQIVLPEWKKFFGEDPVTHHMPNRNPIGSVAIWTPFYLLACALAPIARAVAGKPFPGNSPFHAWIVGLAAVLCTVWGQRQLYVLLLRRYGKPAARVGAIIAVWATALVWYTVAQPLYQHAAVFGLTAWLVEYWDRTHGQTDWRRFALLGLWIGYATAVRAQELCFFTLPAAELLAALRRPDERARAIRNGGVFTLFSFIGVLPQLLVWYYYFGLARPHLEPVRWATPFPLSALFSTRSGLFPWTPIVYASCLGLLLEGWKSAERRLVGPVLAAFLLNLYIVACGWLVHGSYGFGSRRLSDGATLFAIGVALLWRRFDDRHPETAGPKPAPWKRRLVSAYVVFTLCLNLMAMELQRNGVTGSSGGASRTVSDYLVQMHLPRQAGWIFDQIGNPFVQPAGWLFALWHWTPVTSPERIIGQPFLERDSAWLGLLQETRFLKFTKKRAPWIVEGAELFDEPKDPKVLARPARITGPVRIVGSFFAKERVGVLVRGQILDVPGEPIRITWNRSLLPWTRVPEGVRFEVPESIMNAGVNDITLELPVGSQVVAMEFDSYAIPK